MGGNYAGFKNGWLHAIAVETGQLLASFNAHAPVLQVLNGREGSRIVLRLHNVPRLAIVCLHNCPSAAELTSAQENKRRRRSRATSMTSLGSEGEKHTWA